MAHRLISWLDDEIVTITLEPDDRRSVTLVMGLVFYGGAAWAIPSTAVSVS
jgi:hypothetical protein